MNLYMLQSKLPPKLIDYLHFLLKRGSELGTDGQTDRQTDDPITRIPPAELSGRGHK